MKRLLTLAPIVAMLAILVASAVAGERLGKPDGFAYQTGGQQVQSTAKVKPAQQSPSQSLSQTAQSQSYQGSRNDQATPSKLKPNYPVEPTGLSRVPKFGFESTFGWNNDFLGEHVTHVQFGGPAGRLGLEPGDAIVGVNGRDLQTANCWYNAIERAADQDGWVTLKIVDGRSGRMAYRTANLFQLHAR